MFQTLEEATEYFTSKTEDRILGGIIESLNEQMNNLEKIKLLTSKSDKPIGEVYPYWASLKAAVEHQSEQLLIWSNRLGIAANEVAPIPSDANDY